MTSLAERAAQLSPNARAALARELVRAGTAFPTDISESVAVVGIGCRFPGNVTGPDSFWQLLVDGRDAISEIPPDRWDANAFYDLDPSVSGRMTTKWGGFVSDVDAFDADFFGITPREAVAMDPQHRILLEVAWESIEHAGIIPDSLSGTRTAVMMGLSSWDYTIVNIERRADIDAYLSTGTPHCAAVGRISYLLGLRGPAVAVDTACSSSLVAIHLACQSLRLRESDVALAGGVQLTLSPFTAIALSKWSALSPTGRCNSFDANADGFVRGEGCGVVVLKRLADALRDQDRVLAVVRGSATNQDGRSNGMTAPNALAQRDVITTALRLADVTPDSVNYVETHGTGTVLGDPIEFESLSATYGRGEGSCALGSVKTNIGHLEAAAGVAGFIKTVLAVQRGHIPRNLHFTRWNPAIDASATRLFVPTENAPWPAVPGPRRGAVSSFGLSGTNAHVVIEQAPDMTAPTAVGKPHVSALVVSGKTAIRVASAAAALADWMSGPGAAAPLADVAYTLSQHRVRHPKFATVLARDHAEAVAGLRALASGQPRVGVVGCDQQAAEAGRVFVYSGQGSQWAGMGRQLLVDEPAFAKAVAELEPIFVAQTGFSLQQTLADGDEVVGIERIQPVLVGMQLALTELWRFYGVTPDAVIGHSMGEVSAAVVAGALTPEQGLRVIVTRSRLMARLSGQGAMALLELDADATESLIAGYPQVTLAVYASPCQSVIAGPPESVDAVISTVGAQNRLARRVDVEVASHHSIIDPILPELRSALADLVPHTLSIPIISTTHENTQAVMDADYWAANLRNPVRFHQAIAQAVSGVGGSNRACHSFIEISPHPVLTHAITDTVGGIGGHIVTSAMNRDLDQTLFFHAQLAVVGVTESDNANGRLVDLPSTPWQHSRFWVADRSAMSELATIHPLLGVHIEVPGSRDHVWQADVGTGVCPWLADHKVFGHPIMPAAAFAEIALAAANEALGIPAHAFGANIVINQFEVEQMLPLDNHTPLTTQLSRHGDSKIRVEVYSRSFHGDFFRHATAQVEYVPHHVAQPYQRTSGSTNGVTVSPADFYAVLRQTGQHHGPVFAALTRITRLPDGSAETEITVSDEVPWHHEYRLHPVVLDAALQSVGAAIPDGEAAGSAEVIYLPVSFETIRVYRDSGRHVRCRARLTNLDSSAGKLGKIVLIDDDGYLVAEVDGIYLRRVERRAVPLPLAQKIFDTEWVESPLLIPVTSESAIEVARASWLVLTDLENSAKSLADEFIAGWCSPMRRVHTANLHNESAMLAAFAETTGDPEYPPVGVVIFVGSAATGLDDGLVQARDSVWSISTVVRAIVGTWHGRSPRLWLIAVGGLSVQDDEPGTPATAALKGLVRVLALEHPDLRATLLDLDARQARQDRIAALTTELHSSVSESDVDDVIVWRGERRFVERLCKATCDASKDNPVVRPGAAYVITGGLGGLGLVVARWLVDRGASRVVLGGRSDADEEQRKILAELEVRAEIVLVRGNVALPGVAERLVEAAGRAGGQLRGIVHGAAVIEDSLVSTMTRENLERVWEPKATGALRMHQASASCELDWWLGFSSVASLLGSPGQAAYACASAWLDALVTWRKASSLPAAVINWGPWSDVGVAQALVGSVLDAITPAEGLEALDLLLASGRTRTGVARLRADKALVAFPEMRSISYFSWVVEQLDAGGALGDWVGPDALTGLDPAEAQRVVAERMCARIAAVMGYTDQSTVDPAVPLTELGLDSLMAVRIRNGARADFGVEPPVTLILQGASLLDLTADLVRQLGLAGSEQELENTDTVRDRAHQRAAARHGAAMRRRPRLDVQGGWNQ
ncbi:polyketide synthase [Mycobacterium uberis]|uniref:Polyketide synthase n=1 Tax=Mycobacterium uberis TaxID=2162698 RepID=A0A3E1HK93_9MYCO|nr:type I polyketide synthase [Mycobacterium uberis]RFD26846.1 polyketide synthase [Mycobacterium uberis]